MGSAGGGDADDVLAEIVGRGWPPGDIRPPRRGGSPAGSEAGTIAVRFVGEACGRPRRGGVAAAGIRR